MLRANLRSRQHGTPPRGARFSSRPAARQPLCGVQGGARAGPRGDGGAILGADPRPGGHAKWVQLPHGPATVSGRRIQAPRPGPPLRLESARHSTVSGGPSLGSGLGRRESQDWLRVRTPGARGVFFGARDAGRSTALLEARGLSFSYPQSRPRGARERLVLDDVSLAVRSGDLLGILGPNGSGKTTLLNILAGALAPDRGEVQLDGRPISTWTRRDVARHLALVPPHTHAPFDFSVLDVVLMGRYPHLGPFALEGPADLAIARAALRATGTDAFEDRPFHT